VIKTSIQYLLLLSFLLAFLPSENSRQHGVTKTKHFVVGADHVQTLAPSENSKRPEGEKEDPHPVSVLEPLVPVAIPQSFQYFAFSLQLDIPAYYPIRAPPAQA
jgi:hypothetical protein